MLIVKTINKITNNTKNKKAATPSKEEQLLTEIRDLLKEKKNNNS